MSLSKRQELEKRYNELIDKYNDTKSMALKGYYVAEMVVIGEMLANDSKEQ